jgi:two-component sensor histidine kinase
MGRTTAATTREFAHVYMIVDLPQAVYVQSCRTVPYFDCWYVLQFVSAGATQPARPAEKYIPKFGRWRRQFGSRIQIVAPIGLPALREIARAIASVRDLDSTLDLVAHKTTEVMGVDSCTIYLLDPGQRTLRLRASTGLARRAVGRGTLHVGEGLTGWAVEHNQPATAPVARADPRFKVVPEADEKQFASLLAVPMNSEERTIGALNVQTLEPHAYSPDEIELLALIGELAAGALDKAALHDNMQRQISDMTALARVSEAVTSPIYLDEMLDVVTEMAAKVMQAAVCSIFLLDDATGKLVMHSARRNQQAYAARDPIPLGEGISGRVAETGQPLTVRDVREDPRYRNQELARAEGLVSMLAVPLTVRDKVIGVLNCFTAESRDFGPEQVALFSTLANQTALALENGRLVTNAAVVREMHHRIKNNLQTVAMLMRMQMSLVGSELTAREVLQQSINRIQTIAAVHEVLSEQSFRLVNVKEVIERICRMMSQNMIPPGKTINIMIEGEALTLPTRPATSLALAVTELFQNAVEHAFAERDAGQICITLAPAAKFWLITVADDGVGLPNRIPSSLGLEIVETLVRDDLKGRLNFHRSRRGARVDIRLPRASVQWGLD